MAAVAAVVAAMDAVEVAAVAAVDAAVVAAVADETVAVVAADFTVVQVFDISVLGLGGRTVVHVPDNKLVNLEEVVADLSSPLDSSSSSSSSASCESYPRMGLSSSSAS